MGRERRLTYLFIFLVFAGFFIFIYFAQLKISGFVPANDNANVPPQVQGEIILKDKSGEVVPAEFSIYKGGEKVKDRQSQGNIKSGRYKAVITPNSGPIKRIEIPDLNVNQDQNILLYRDVPETISSPTNNKWKEAYALDMSLLDFSNATIQATASGNSLFKCVDWDFQAGVCNGKWKKIMDIIPGQDYNFSLTPLDPGIGELNNSVNLLNKNNELLNYNEKINNQGGKVKINITPQETGGFYKEILVESHNINSNAGDLILYELNNSNYPDTKVIDNSNLDAVSITATFKKGSSSKDVLECSELNSEDNCAGKWKKFLDISNDSYAIIKTTPGKSAYGISSDELLLLDKNLQVIPNDQQVIRKGGADSDIGIQLSYIRPDKITTFYRKNNASQNELQIDYNETEEIYSLKFSDLASDYAEISASAKGRDLFECDDWNFEGQKCNGKFLKKEDLNVGESYTFRFNYTSSNVSYAFKENKNRVALLDKNDYLYNYSESVISSYPDGSEDLEISFSGGNVKKIIIKEYDALSSVNDLKIELNTSERGFLQSFSIDPSLINMEEAQFTITALGYALMKCPNWNFTSQNCIDRNWTKLFDTTPGQDYVLNVSSSDPGFGELGESQAVSFVNFGESNIGGSSSGGGSSGLSRGNSLKNAKSSVEMLEKNKTNTESLSNSLENEQFEIYLINVQRRKGFLDVEYGLKNTGKEDKEIKIYLSILDSADNLISEIEDVQIVLFNSENLFGISIPIDKKLNKEKLFIIVDFEKFSNSNIEGFKLIPISGMSILDIDKKNSLLIIVLSFLLLILLFFYKKFISSKTKK